MNRGFGKTPNILISNIHDVQEKIFSSKSFTQTCQQTNAWLVIAKRLNQRLVGCRFVSLDRLGWSLWTFNPQSWKTSLRWTTPTIMKHLTFRNPPFYETKLQTICPNGMIFHQPRFPWNFWGFPETSATILGAQVVWGRYNDWPKNIIYSTSIYSTSSLTENYNQ